MRWPWSKKEYKEMTFVSPDVVYPEPFIAGEVEEATGKLEEDSATWKFIKHWATEELNNVRIKNDSIMDAEKTASLRGEIRLLKQIIKLPEVLQSRENRLTRSTRLNIAGDDDE